jgi:hypothetical protein
MTFSSCPFRALYPMWKVKTMNFLKFSKPKVKKVCRLQKYPRSSGIFELQIFISESIRVDRFYLPHMEYEGSIGFVIRKLIKNIADFHV